MIYQRNFRVSHRVKNPQYVPYTKALILQPFKLHRIGSTYELGQPQWKKVPPKLIEQRINRRFFFVRSQYRQAMQLRFPLLAEGKNASCRHCDDGMQFKTHSFRAENEGNPANEPNRVKLFPSVSARISTLLLQG